MTILSNIYLPATEDKGIWAVQIRSLVFVKEQDDCVFDVIQ